LGNNQPNNWYGIRNRNGREGFRYFAHDSEHTLLNVNESRVGPYPAGSALLESSPQWIHQQLMFVDEYRMRFADLSQKHLFNDGVLTPAAALDSFNARMTEIDQAIVAESARWGDSKRTAPFLKSDWINAGNGIRTGFFPGRTDVLLNQLRATTLNGGAGSAPLFPSTAAVTLSINNSPQHGG
jgi:hypothetical protein